MRRPRRRAAPHRAVALAIGMALGVAALDVDEVPAQRVVAGTRPAVACPTGDAGRPRGFVPDEAVEEEPQEGEEPEEESDDVAAEPSRLPRLLRFVDPDGAPVDGVVASWPDAKAMLVAAADERGELTIETAATELRVTLAGPGAPDFVDVATPETTVVVPKPRMLEVRVVDGRTGTPLHGGTFRVRRGETTSAPRTGLVPVDSAHSVHIDPPPGFGCFTSHSVGAVARRARSARLDVAVWPGAATWTFRAIDFEGRPIAGAAASVALDEHSVTSRSETSGDDGVLRVRDIPSIPFLRRMDVRVGTSQSCGSVYGLSLDDGPPEAPIDVVFTNGGRYRGPGADVRGCPAPSGVDRRRMAPLTVRVLDRDGAPAAAVDVVCSGEDRRTTDADGCVRFPALPIGPARFVAGAYGFLPTAAAAEIGRDETLEIAETGPRRVRVIVTDAQGRVLPSAEVGIESEYVDGPDGGRARFCCDIVQIEDGVQILSPLTDSSGSVDVDAARGRMCFSVRLGGARATVSSEDDVVCVTLGGD